ncbi:MAG: hypothetical protein ACUVXA_16540 [Candidatus Jordarchaeum sp.]|uniref:hypothetical protein n=1 Tax=Candidatus Jordarchaeum sp. TaxID=2823881 RepID=UPI00404B5A51
MAIKGVYVIRDTGYSLFHRIYSDYDNIPDEDLISGFISAIFSFSKEFGKGQITKMETKFLKFFYHLNDKIIFVIITELENDKNDSAIVKLLHTIAESFVKKFGGKIYEEIDRSTFSDFRITVDQLIENYDKANNYGNNLMEQNLKAPEGFVKDVSETKSDYNMISVKVKESKMYERNKEGKVINGNIMRQLFSEKPFDALKLLTRRFISQTEKEDNEKAVVPDH